MRSLFDGILLIFTIISSILSALEIHLLEFLEIQLDETNGL